MHWISRYTTTPSRARQVTNPPKNDFMHVSFLYVKDTGVPNASDFVTMLPSLLAQFADLLFLLIFPYNFFLINIIDESKRVNNISF